MQLHDAREFQTEKEFSQAVVDFARAKGWLVFRTYHSKHSPPGEPDLRMVRPPRVIFAELKVQRGKVSIHQELALECLRACPGVETYLWRPDCWNTLERILE